MGRYFEQVMQEEGLNMIAENPCKLLDFGKLVLGEKRRAYDGNTGDSELVIVILSGTCDVKVGGQSFNGIGGRSSVFHGKPYALYIPPKTDYELTISSEKTHRLEAAFAFAKAAKEQAAFVIKPDEVVTGKWGISNFARDFRLILVEGVHQHSVNRLIVGETLVPSGNWATYPPHKHEKDDPPREVFMEEMYYFKVSPPEGWGLAKCYTEDGELDEVKTIRDETILKMPKGYHTVVSAPGCVMYYLWFLAGNTRTQRAVTDPKLAWIEKAIPMIGNIKENLSI